MARFEIYEAQNQEYRWRFVSDNGRIMADSAEGYVNKAGAERAVEDFRELARNAITLFRSKEKVYFEKDEATGKWKKVDKK